MLKFIIVKGVTYSQLLHLLTPQVSEIGMEVTQPYQPCHNYCNYRNYRVPYILSENFSSQFTSQYYTPTRIQIKISEADQTPISLLLTLMRYDLVLFGVYPHWNLTGYEQTSACTTGS